MHSPLDRLASFGMRGCALADHKRCTRRRGGIGDFNQQLTADSGAGAVLGDFKSSTYAIGPQVGWFFPVGSAKGDLNLRGYWEFATDHRPEGWNVWLTVGLPFGGAVH